MFKIILQLHGGGKGGSSTTVQSYQPTDEEKRLWTQQADFQDVVMPYAESLVGKSSKILENSLGDTQYAFDKLNTAAQEQIANAQTGVAKLQTGVLPTAYQENMENSIKSGVQNTMGSTLNSLASRGVLNSSVTNQAMNDISKNVSDTMAEQYSNNISTLNGLYGQQASLATNGISAAAAAQEAAQSPSLSLLNASLGVSSSNTGAISALSGTGTTTSTQNTSSGNGWSAFGTGLLSTAASVYCFTDDTMIKTADGTEKRISNVKVGDEVVCYDKENDKDVTERVVAVSKPHYDITYAVICSNFKNTKTVVYTTLTQPLLTEDGEFVTVDNLKVGTKLKNVGKLVGIVESGERRVYDFKTEGVNTYYANNYIAYGAYDGELE